jgi:hypothetical protein
MRAALAILAGCTPTSEPAFDAIARRDLALERPIAQLTSFAPRPSIVQVSLSVETCTSVYGVERDDPPKVPSTATVSIRADLAVKVALYTDEKRQMGPLLGPRDWSCRAMQGANGSVEMFLVDGPVPSGQSWTIAKPQERVVLASIPSACCADTEACSLVPRARVGVRERLMLDPLATGACAPPPKNEIVTWMRGSLEQPDPAGDIVRFFDPPDVKGSGYGSGGKNPAHGILSYSRLPEIHSAVARKMTCVLPPEDAGLCEALLEHFAASE